MKMLGAGGTGGIGGAMSLTSSAAREFTVSKNAKKIRSITLYKHFIGFLSPMLKRPIDAKIAHLEMPQF
jgi:hypothetical protein